MGEEGWRASQSACFPRMPGQCRTRATVPSAWLPREMGAIFDSVGIRKRLQLGDPHRVPLLWVSHGEPSGLQTHRELVGWLSKERHLATSPDA